MTVLSRPKDIVINGFPKSGNTWLTRLVAELIECPIAGFLGRDAEEIATEGLHRKSEYKCYKSHHDIDFLLDSGIEISNIIYIVRDPRDVCLSAARYFDIGKFHFISWLVKWSNLPTKRKFRIYKLINGISPLPFEKCIAKLSKAIVRGDETIHWFLGTPWRDHYKQYQSRNCLVVKYEHLLDDPEVECQRILTHLGIEKTRAHIVSSIHKQSLEVKKRFFIEYGDSARAQFLKVGTKSQWPNQLPPDQISYFRNKLGEDIKNLGYIL
jgi:hypothetical protein